RERRSAGASSLAPAGLSWLGGEESVEEGAVAGEGDAEVFGGDVVALVPLGFEPLAFVGEAGGESLHEVGDQGVGFRDGVARLVDEARLDLLPAGGEALALVRRQERLTLCGSGGGCRF